MLFNSTTFFVFLAVVCALYRVLPHRGQNALLLAASYVFYAAWDYRFLGLILTSTVVDYTVSRALAREKRPAIRKRLLLVSLVVNLGILGFFKYFNFFVGSAVDLLGLLGLHANWQSLNIILPVGISFYTFQNLSYTLDVYREELEPEHDFLNFALFTAFFPQLAAGPIERASRLLPQIAKPRKLEFEQSAQGCYLLLLGLFKKVVVADGIAPTVTAVFERGGGASGAEVMAASYLFFLQIYGDFSGYSDMARGSAKLLGIELMRNFDAPFFSASPSEYWTRWHISLSSWVKDYVYLPMALHYMRRGVSKLNEWRPHIYSMVLMGLWHGAAWTYVVWGAFHGLMLVLWSNKWPKRYKHLRKKIPRAVWVVIYFQVTAYSMMLFRAESVAQIGEFTTALLTNFWSGQFHLETPPLSALVGLPVLLVLEVLTFRASDLFYVRWQRPVRAGLYAALVVLLALGSSNAPAEFIYFQF